MTYQFESFATILSVDDITLSVYHPDDTQAERVIMDVNGVNVQVIHHQGDKSSTVFIGEHAAQIKNENVVQYIKDRT